MRLIMKLSNMIGINHYRTLIVFLPPLVSTNLTFSIVQMMGTFHPIAPHEHCRFSNSTKCYAMLRFILAHIDLLVASYCTRATIIQTAGDVVLFFSLSHGNPGEYCCFICDPN